MFWFIVFIVVVGLIVEGLSVKKKNEKSGGPTYSQLLSEREQDAEIARLSLLAEELLASDEVIAEIKPLAKESLPSGATDVNAVKEPKAESVISPRAPSVLAHELEDWGVKSLWHMTHIRNVPSIKRTGLLSHQSPKLKMLSPVDISDPEVQRWRTKQDPCFGLALHDYVPFYINPRNPMLYRRKNIQREICFIEISLEALEDTNFLVSDGNAASAKTQFYSGSWGMQFLPWEVLRKEFWTDFDDGKRKACSEILVPYAIDQKFIKAMHCFSSAESGRLAQKGINAVVSIDKYFR
jgi:hypothetical protein